MHKLLAVLAVVILAAGALTGCKGDAPAGALPRGVVARVGGQDIPQAELDLRVSVFELYFQEPMGGVLTRSQLLEQLIEEKLLVAEAQKQSLKVDDTRLAQEVTAFQAALEERYRGEDGVAKKLKELKLSAADLKAFLAEFLLAQQMVDVYKESVKLTDDEIKQFYEQNKDSLYTFTEPVVRARHILVPAEKGAQARELAERAQKGEDFSKLAREYSVDPGSGRAGGDIGYFRKSDMVPEFADLAFKLQPGEVGNPVQSRFGWHVIKVDDARPPGAISFDLARSDMMNKLLPAKQNEALARWLDGLKQATPVQKVEFAADPVKK